MNPDEEARKEEETTSGELEDLEANDEEGAAVQGGIAMRKAGEKPLEY